MRSAIRAGATCALLTSVVLCGCSGALATRPASQRPVALAEGESAARFNTGRVSLSVTDWAGKPLAKARVDVESVGDDEYFRTAALSDDFGRVTFAGVPREVRITVYHAATQGNYSRQFDVPSSGITELRMMLDTTL